jgi:hypothetical protein
MSDEFGDIWPEPLALTAEPYPAPSQPNDWPGDFGEVFDD